VAVDVDIADLARVGSLLTTSSSSFFFASAVSVALLKSKSSVEARFTTMGFFGSGFGSGFGAAMT